MHPKFNLETMGDLVEHGAEPETTIAAEAICEVFGVTRWDDRAKTGLIDWELIALMDQFHQHLEALKKKPSPGPISPEPTDSTF